MRYNGKAKKPVIYRGEDVVEVFLNHLECEASNINNIFANPKPLIMTEKIKIDYENTTDYWICKQEIGNKKNKPKVRHHCNFTGEFRGVVYKS